MYTKDYFICGLCGINSCSINEYVNHMIQKENCELVLEPSLILKDLLLPRFKYVEKNSDQFTKDDKKKNFKNKLDDLDSEDVKIQNIFTHKVETGAGFRWKCKLCFLTFSRQAAFLNHYKIQHELKKEIEDITEETVKREPNTDSNETQTTSNVEKHLAVVNVKKCDVPPTCHICGQIFKTERILISHTETVHSQKRPFSCDINSCSISFKTKGSLIRHQRRHTGERPFLCLQCRRSFRESGSLLRHQQSRTPCQNKSEKQLSRYGITLPFSNDTKVDCKMQLKKEGVDLPNLCEIDRLSTLEESKASVRLQIQSAKIQSQSESLSKLSKPNIMPEKETILNLKQELVSHDDLRLNLEVNDEENVKPPPVHKVFRQSFICPVCARIYDQEIHLCNHIKVHLAELGNKCSICEKCFNGDQALIRHLISHSSARNFECNICGKSFKLKSHAISHLTSHSDLKTVPCTECGRHFKSVSSRNTHMKIHTCVKNFECTICFKKFLVKASLERHLRIHSETKPFQCPHCNKAFREQGTLTRHIKNKDPCSQQIKFDVNNKPEVMETIEIESLNDMTDTFSETGSELESYLSERVDLSSIYSDPSDISFDPEDYFVTL